MQIPKALGNHTGTFETEQAGLNKLRCVANRHQITKGIYKLPQRIKALKAALESALLAISFLLPYPIVN